MMASELIVELTKAIEKYGDIAVEVSVDCGCYGEGGEVSNIEYNANGYYPYIDIIAYG